MLTEFYLQQVTNVLSVDILTKFQRPFIKPYIFTVRRQKLSGFVYALVFHYVSCE